MSGEMRHIEMFTDDVKKARAFYDGLFQWEFKELNLCHAAFMRWEVCCGLDGVFRQKECEGDDDIPGPINYITVEDVDQICERIEKFGGEIIYCSEELQKGGPRIALFADPDGNVLGLWQTINSELLKKTKTE